MLVFSHFSVASKAAFSVQTVEYLTDQNKVSYAYDQNPIPNNLIIYILLIILTNRLEVIEQYRVKSIH